MRETQALWLLNADAKVTWASNLILEWTGKEEKEAIGGLLFEFLDGMDAPPLKEAWHSLHTGAPFTRIEAALDYPNRATRQLRVDLAALRRADGALQGAAGLAIDITDLHQAEKTARGVEAHCRALLNQLPAVLWTTDTAGCITYVNDAVNRVYGHAPKH